MAQVTALAQRGQVDKSVVSFIVVDVRDGQYHLTAGHRMRPVVLRLTPFAPALSPTEAYKTGYKAPLWVVFPVVAGHVSKQLSVTAPPTRQPPAA